MAPRFPELEGQDLRVTTLLHIEFAPLILKQGGQMRVRAYRGDLEIKLGALVVRGPNAPAALAPDPNQDTFTAS